jgi:hypothetical protein
MKKITVFVCVLLSSINNMTAQDIPSHQWKERVLIVLTTDTSNTIYNKQVQLFKDNLPGLKERKVKIYLASPEVYKIFNSDKDSWNKGDSLYQKYKSKDSGIELVLIGLDGSVKSRKSKPGIFFSNSCTLRMRLSRYPPSF